MRKAEENLYVPITHCVSDFQLLRSEEWKAECRMRIAERQVHGGNVHFGHIRDLSRVE